MANHPSAKKRHRQSLKRQERNKHVRSTVRNAIRSVKAAPAGENVSERLAHAERLLRKAQTKGVFHAKTVSRTVARLTRLVQRST
jgi:small subunit ribosomal protein S20